MTPCVWKDFSGERVEREKGTGKERCLNGELKSGNSQKAREITKTEKYLGNRKMCTSDLGLPLTLLKL